jgi:hypothetical protein
MTRIEGKLDTNKTLLGEDEQWFKTGCAGNGAPYVLRALLNRLEDPNSSPFTKSSPEVPRLAAAFLGEDCAGGRGLSAAEIEKKSKPSLSKPRRPRQSRDGRQKSCLSSNANAPLYLLRHLRFRSHCSSPRLLCAGVKRHTAGALCLTLPGQKCNAHRPLLFALSPWDRLCRRDLIRPQRSSRQRHLAARQLRQASHKARGPFCHLSRTFLSQK